MSLRELWDIRRAARQRQHEAYDHDIVSAWYGEYVRLKTQNDKRMPSLKALLRRGNAELPTRAQQLALYQQFSQQFNLRMRVK